MTAIQKTRVEKLTDAWGTYPEDWMLVLAQETDRRGSAREVAEIIGYSPSIISAVINGSYNGTYRHIEQAVRETLMRLSVECPVLGNISGEKCSGHQRVKTVTATNPQTVRLFRACRSGCPHSSLKVTS